MGFGDAVRTCFSKFAEFSGRARPAEYWWWALFSFLVYLIPAILFTSLAAAESGLSGIVGGLWGIFILVLIIPSLAVFVRRMHDTGKSGWWWLIGLVPFVGSIILLVFLVQSGDPGPNQYGDPPA